MNAIELLKKDHERVHALFKSYEQAGDRAHAQKKTISDKIFEALEAHTQVEEEILYPTARDAFPEDDRHLIAEAYEEHAVAKNLIVDMKGMRPGEEDHDAKMKVLKENVEHHIEEEERELFPKLRHNVGSEQLDELGRRLAARKQQFIELRQPLTGSLVKMVSRAFNSLTNGQATPTRKTAARKVAAGRKTSSAGRKRAVKRTATKRSATSATARRKKTGTTGGGKRRASGGSSIRAARAAAKKTAARTRRKATAMGKNVRNQLTKAVKKLRKQAKAGRPRRRASR